MELKRSQGTTAPCSRSGWNSGLTVEVDVSIGQGQKRRVQRVVGVPQDGVPLVYLLHHIRVQAVLLEKNGAMREWPQAYHNKHTHERTKPPVSTCTRMVFIHHETPAAWGWWWESSINHLKHQDSHKWCFRINHTFLFFLHSLFSFSFFGLHIFSYVIKKPSLWRLSVVLFSH